MGEDKKPKKKQNDNAEAGFARWKLWARAVEADDIDPADFFDPEEFGFHRRNQNAPQ